MIEVGRKEEAHEKLAGRLDRPISLATTAGRSSGLSHMLDGSCKLCTNQLREATKGRISPEI